MKTYEKLNKEQLENFCKIKDLEIENIENKLLLLTGCSFFGETDLESNLCMLCHEKNPLLWERCYIFKDALKDFINIEKTKNGDK